MSKAAAVVLLIFFAERKAALNTKKEKCEKCKNSGLTKYNIRCIIVE